MAIAEIQMVTIDSSDSKRDVEFWRAVLGGEVLAAEAEYGMLKVPGGAVLGFGTVPDYQAPSWPNEQGSKQFHLDVSVDDLDAAEAACVEVGATVPDHQPGEGWRVLLDPSGHPFCLTLAGNWE